MLVQSLRASRSSLTRAASMVTKRTFIIPTAVRQADFVQDLYIKELKAYKTPAVKANDSDGHVQKWAAPKAPQSPEETDIANELKSYEASTVDVEGQAEAGVVDTGDDWFEDDWVEDEKKAH